jgi:hypothetical protein
MRHDAAASIAGLRAPEGSERPPPPGQASCTHFAHMLESNYTAPALIVLARQHTVWASCSLRC